MISLERVWYRTSQATGKQCSLPQSTLWKITLFLSRVVLQVTLFLFYSNEELWDHASEMLFIWLTAEFICSIIYLISLTEKKKTYSFAMSFILTVQIFYNLTVCSLSMEKYLPTGMTQMVFLPKPWYMAHGTYVSLSAASEMLKLNVSGISDSA